MKSMWNSYRVECQGTITDTGEKPCQELEALLNRFKDFGSL